MGRKQKSILGHIRTVVILGLILMVIFAELASAISIAKALTRDIKEEISLESFSEKKFIDTWLSRKVEETELIAKSVATMDADFTDEFMQNYLMECASTDTDVLNYYVCRAGIPYVIYNGGIFDLDPTGRSWWTEAWNAGSTIITDAYVDANSGAIVISVATPFYINDVQSVILADITMSTVIDTLQNVGNENLAVFLLAKDGTILVHEKDELCMQADGSSKLITDVCAIDFNNPETSTYNDEDNKKCYVSLNTIDKTGWIVGAYIHKSYNQSRIFVSSIFIFAVLAFVAFLGVLYLAVMLKKLLAPMQDMKTFVREVVVGRENIRHFKVEKAEISFLIAELKEKFVETIKKTKTEMNGIEGDIVETNSSVNEIADAISNISAVIEETAAAMDTQSNNISIISNDCSVISNASIAVAGQAQEMAARSSEIVAKIEELTPKMEAEKERTKTSCAESQAKLNEAIKDAECINEITSISDAIKNIASQTNLLSLNASIESARAGEAGRGFAVVAEEIRGLSDETNNEINKISNLADRLLKAVNTLSQESIASMNQLSEDIEQAYANVGMLSEDYVESAKYYSAISAELGANAEELSASVQTVAESIEDISASQHDIDLAMENASQGIQTVALSTTSMQTKMNSVSTAVEGVSQTVQQFNV